MLKFSGWLFASIFSITAASSVITSSALAATGTPGTAAPGTTTPSASANIVQPLEDKQSSIVVTKTPLKLEAVTSGSLCGTTMTEPERRLCLGENSNEISANDTVSKVERFIIGSGNLCGVDERGVRCWATQGTFEKSVQEILASGDSTRARFGNSKICLPQADKTIHCFSPEQGDWITSENGKDNHYVRSIPKVEIYGPYADLRDFRITESGLCLLDGERVICEKSPNNPNASTNVEVPQTSFKGARGLASIWGTLCVLSDLGLDCVRGSGTDVRKYHVEGSWTSAVRLFESGYDNICGVDKDEQPMCVKLGEKADETTDITPADLLDPSIRVLKFRASGESRCALVEKTSSRERTMLCSTYGKLEPTPLGNDAVDFEVGVDGTCVRNAAGLVSCFRGTSHLPSPLPEDGSKAYTAGQCRWNTSRFHCASMELTTDFSDIKTVIGATSASDDLPLPCVIFENREGLHSVRCFGSAERLVSNAPNLQSDNVKITANYDYACAYGGETTECWGTPLGGVNPPNLSVVKRIIFGRDLGCAKDQFGFVCWGRDLESRGLEVPHGLGDLDSVFDFAVGYEHVCVITREKTIACWGNNRDGQTDVPALTNPISIAASGNTTCATSDEGVTCWGTREGALLGKGQRAGRWGGNENRE
jgi:hypothetical protein